MQTQKLWHLEAARGIASVCVVLHHFTVGFCPAIRNPVSEGGVKFTPLFVLLNGEAAVLFFFLLSGFVLARRFYIAPSILDLCKSVLKRLPRLALPASISILMGYLILKFFPPYYVEAAAINGSLWLKTFAAAQLPIPFEPSLWDALTQSISVFLKPWNFYYNSNLWTMYFEFYGSMIVFGLAAVFIFKRQLALFAHLVAAIAAISTDANFLPFVIGSLLALLRKPTWRSSGLTTGVIVLTAILFSLNEWWASLGGSILAMTLLLKSDMLATHLSGRLGVALGKISFPLYLCHTLVIVSLSSAVFLRYGIAAAFLSTILASLIISIPLVVVDHFWIRLINAVAKRFQLRNYGFSRLDRNSSPCPPPITPTTPTVGDVVLCASASINPPLRQVKTSS